MIELQQQNTLDLHYDALKAIHIDDFNARSKRAADISSIYATSFIPKLRTTFYNACLDSCKAYNGVQKDTEEYAQAHNKASEMAQKYLPEALSEAGMDTSAEDLTKKMDFRLALRLAQKITGNTEDFESLSEEQIKDRLRMGVSSNDYFYSKIDSIQLEETTEADSLESATEIAVRLANATWLSSQIQRAALGETNRINPNQKRNFDIYDNMIKNIANENGIFAAAFEIYKDMLQFK